MRCSDSPWCPRADTHSPPQHASGQHFPASCTDALLTLCFLGLCGFEDLGLMSSSTKGQVCVPTPCPLTPTADTRRVCLCACGVCVSVLLWKRHMCSSGIFSRAEANSSPAWVQNTDKQREFWRVPCLDYIREQRKLN